MLWSAFFVVGIAQALFLISLVLFIRKKNLFASTIIVVMLAAMIVPNLSCLSLASGIYHDFPDLFSISFGISFLFGPLFYLYTRTILDSSFRWKWGFGVHFIPFLVYKVTHLGIYGIAPEQKTEFVHLFLSGELDVLPAVYLFYAAQNILLFGYLVFSFRLIRLARIQYAKTAYIIPMAQRERWLKQLYYCFSLFLLVNVVYLVILFIVTKYTPTANYISTLLISSIIYFVAYKLVLSPEIIIPDFAHKYKTYHQFESAETEVYAKKLRERMEEGRVFMDPELNLNSLSAMVGLSSHQLSKLINEHLGKSFADFVNEYRVQEFVRKLDDPESRLLSIYGIALDVGFRTKSSFNAVFKKFTGQTPSSYRESTRSIPE